MFQSSNCVSVGDVLIELTYIKPIVCGLAASQSCAAGRAGCLEGSGPVREKDDSGCRAGRGQGGLWERGGVGGGGQCSGRPQHVGDGRGRLPSLRRQKRVLL